MSLGPKKTLMHGGVFTSHSTRKNALLIQNHYVNVINCEVPSFVLFSVPLNFSCLILTPSQLFKNMLLASNLELAVNIIIAFFLQFTHCLTFCHWVCLGVSLEVYILISFNGSIDSNSHP